MTYVLNLTSPDYGLSVAHNNNFAQGLRTVGQTKMHRRNVSAPVNVQISWLYNDKQMEEFRKSWDRVAELNHGHDWILIDLPIGIDVPNNYLNQMGEGYERVKAHFVGPYGAQYQSHAHWRVSAVLDVDVSLNPGAVD